MASSRSMENWSNIRGMRPDGEPNRARIVEILIQGFKDLEVRTQSAVGSDEPRGPGDLHASPAPTSRQERG